MAQAVVVAVTSTPEFPEPLSNLRKDQKHILDSPPSTDTTLVTEAISSKSWPPIPLLRFKANDVSSAGATAFFANINVTTMLREAVEGVLAALYTSDTVPARYVFRTV